MAIIKWVLWKDSLSNLRLKAISYRFAAWMRRLVCSGLVGWNQFFSFIEWLIRWMDGKPDLLRLDQIRFVCSGYWWTNKRVKGNKSNPVFEVCTGEIDHRLVGWLFYCVSFRISFEMKIASRTTSLPKGARGSNKKSSCMSLSWLHVNYTNSANRKQ